VFLFACRFRIFFETKNEIMKRFLVAFILVYLAASQAQAQDSTASLIQFKDVIINAVKASDKDPFTKSDISKADIEVRNQGKDIPLLLENQVGLITTSDAGAGVGYSSMRIRGSDQTRINITINGIPVNDAESQQVYFVNTPDLASSANGIQIQRGVGASTNGGGAFGASVNIQNNDFSKKPFGEFITTYGSFNTWRHTLRGGSGLIKNKFLIEAQLSKISSDGYIDRAASDLWSYHIKAALLLKKTKLQLVHFGGYEKTYQAWYGVVQDSLSTNRTFNVAGTDFGARPLAYFNQIDNYRQHYLQAFLTHQFNQKWTIDFAAFSTFGKGYFEEFKADQRLSKYQLNSITSTRGDIVRRRWLDNVFFGGLWGVGFENKKWNVKVGGMAAQYFGDHFGNVISCSTCENVDSKNNYYFSKGKKNRCECLCKSELLGDVKNYPYS
jgi:iron complex outermembrane receptor protein